MNIYLILQCKRARYKVSFRNHRDEVVMQKSNKYRKDHMEKCDLSIKFIWVSESLCLCILKLLIHFN